MKKQRGKPAGPATPEYGLILKTLARCDYANGEIAALAGLKGKLELGGKRGSLVQTRAILRFRVSQLQNAEQKMAIWYPVLYSLLFVFLSVLLGQWILNAYLLLLTFAIIFLAFVRVIRQEAKAYKREIGERLYYEDCLALVEEVLRGEGEKG